LFLLFLVLFGTYETYFWFAQETALYTFVWCSI
jgi:hypothetical protein